MTGSTMERSNEIRMKDDSCRQIKTLDYEVLTRLFQHHVQEMLTRILNVLNVAVVVL